MYKENEMNRSILIVDDDEQVRELLMQFLSEKYDCVAASSAGEALHILEKQEIALMLSDINMEGLSGIELVERVPAISPFTVSIMISGEQDIGAPIGALKAGAADYIRKPFVLSDLSTIVTRGLERRRSAIEKYRREILLSVELDQHRSEIEYAKRHDRVTGLLNRESFIESITKVIDDRPRRSSAMILFTLDGLARSNERPWEAASQTLRELAKTWNSLDARWTVGKIDERLFAVFLPDITCSVEALSAARRINESVRGLKFGPNSSPNRLSIRAGIAVYPNDGTTAAGLVRSAGIALKQTSATGPGSIKFHMPQMNQEADRRAELEAEVQTFIANGELLNFYQPKIDFATGEVVSMEALARWQSPKFGMVSPTEFIPICEELGLADPVGISVLEDACRDTKMLLDRGTEIKVSVNISGKQLANAWLPVIVKSALVRSGLPAEMLELEITETSLIENADVASNSLSQLKAIGVGIAIDDFGTGFSSLSYLKQFPIDTLKIDKIFVRDLENDPRDIEFVKAIVSMAGNLNMRTIVEGVESPGQLELLSGVGCDEWQGFLCSRPVPIDEIDRLVTSRAADIDLALAV